MMMMMMMIVSDALKLVQSSTANRYRKWRKDYYI